MLRASALPVSTGVVSWVCCTVSVGATGGVMSSVKLPLPVLTLPPASVLTSVTAFTPPSLRLRLPEIGAAAPVSIDQRPSLLATALNSAPPTPTVTALPASALPLSTGVVSLVSWVPSVGTAGAVASSVKLPVVAAVLPAASVLVTVTAFAPSPVNAKLPLVGLAAAVSSVHCPASLATTVNTAPPTATVTVLPASAVPLSTGVLLLVVPPAAKVGAAGGVVSSVKLPVPGALLPAASVPVKVTAFTLSVPSSKLPLTGVAVSVFNVHLPSPLATTLKVAPPTVTSTTLPASARPSSTGVVSLVSGVVNDGAAGGKVSTKMPRVATCVAPLSVALALITTEPCPIASACSALSTALQVVPVTTALSVCVPIFTDTVAPALQVPLTVRPCAASALFTLLSSATVVIATVVAWLVRFDTASTRPPPTFDAPSSSAVSPASVKVPVRICGSSEINAASRLPATSSAPDSAASTRP